MKLVTTFILTLLFLFTGCNRQKQMTDSECNNEFPNPELVVVDEPTEPSLSIPHRGWQERTAYYENVDVKHPALYLESPYEKKGSNDGYFKTWDRDSAISLVASPVIFVGNVIVWPVHLVLSPPWKMQTSRSVYPVQQPVSALPAEPSRAASKNSTHHEEHEDF